MISFDEFSKRGFTILSMFEFSKRVKVAFFNVI